MEYVIPAVLVVLVVGGFVMFMVLNATKKSGPAGDGDEGAPGIGGDESPLGDTTQHAGEQTEHGTTVGAHDAPSTPGTTPGRADPDAAAHVARPGEGEGAERLEFEGDHSPAGDAQARAPRRTPDRPDAAETSSEPAAQDPEPSPPASERLADRGV